MRRKGILVGVIAILALLSAVLVGQHTGGDCCGWVYREPIYIHGNAAFTCENGVVAGCGTPDDPFIIEGWIIDSPPTDYGITLDHTTAYVVIRDCVVERAQGAGITLNCVANARIDGCRLTLNNTGITFLNARCNIVENTAIAFNHYGVVMGVTSRDNCITANSFVENGLNGLDPDRRNQWYCHGVGNYWSDYDGADCDGDGVGDRPYFRLSDCYPLVCPPSAEAPHEPPTVPAEMPEAVIAPVTAPVVEPTLPEPTPPAPAPEAEPKPEPEPAVEPAAVQTPSDAVAPASEPDPVVPTPPEPESVPEPAPEPEQPPEPAVEPRAESVPSPESPQTAQSSDTE